MDCTVTVIDSLPALREVLPEWKGLVSSGELEANFYQDPEVVRLMLESSDGTLRPSIVLVRREGRITCIAPFYVQQGRFELMLSVARVASWPVRQLRIAGEQFICRKEDVCDSDFDAVFQALRRQAPAFDVIRVFNLSLAGPLWNYLQSERSHGYVIVSSSTRTEKVIQARLGSDYRAYLASLNGRVRQKLLRRTRDFWKHANGAAAVVKVTRADQVREFLADVDAVYAQSWQSRTYGTRTRSTAPEVAYFEAIAANGWLRSYILRAPDPVAFVVGYQFGGMYHFDETGYDQRWTEWGPGAVLTHQLIEELFACDTPETLDFGFGDAQYKRTLGNVELDACAGYIVSRNRWRVLLGAQQVLNVIYDAARSALIRLRIDAQVRRLVKHRT